MDICNIMAHSNIRIKLLLFQLFCTTSVRKYQTMEMGAQHLIGESNLFICGLKQPVVSC